MFRGREITHREIGQAILTRIGVELKEIAVIEQAPRLEGRLLFMILAPNPRWLQSNRARQEAAASRPQPRPAPAPSEQPAAPPVAPPAPVLQAEAPKA
jgi:translation initiation factor IF-3